MTAVQEPNRLYTLLPGVYKKNRYLHGSRSIAKSAIYIAAGCIHKTVIYTAAIQEPTRLNTLLPVYIRELVIYTAAVQEPNWLYDFRSAD